MNDSVYCPIAATASRTGRRSRHATTTTAMACVTSAGPKPQQSRIANVKQMVGQTITGTTPTDGVVEMNACVPANAARAVMIPSSAYSNSTPIV